METFRFSRLSMTLVFLLSALASSLQPVRTKKPSPGLRFPCPKG